MTHDLNQSGQVEVCLSGIDDSGIHATTLKSAVITWKKPKADTEVHTPNNTPTQPITAPSPSSASSAPPPSAPPPPFIPKKVTPLKEKNEVRQIIVGDVLKVIIPLDCLSSAKAKLRWEGNYNEPQVVISLDTLNLVAGTPQQQVLKLECKIIREGEEVKATFLPNAALLTTLT